MKLLLTKVLQEARVYVTCAVFILLNFVPFLLPLVLYSAIVWGKTWCRVILAAAVDFAVPLRNGPKAYWPLLNRILDDTRGVEEYNQLEIIVESEEEYKNKDQNFCVCYFPHSLYPGCILPIREYFSRTAGSFMLHTGVDAILYIPFLRRYTSWWGLTSVSKKKLKKNLQLPYPYNILVLNPDGIVGMFYGIDREQIVLAKRKGFCKIALQTGVSLVPCYVFGANELYNRYWGPRSLARKLSSKFRVSIAYWSGRIGVPFGFIPKKGKLVIALGHPIHVTKISNPTQEEVEALHAQFVEAIKALYDRHKYRMGKDWVKKRSRLYLENEVWVEHHTKHE